MNTQIEAALAQKLLALADDELILAHRDGEWTGHAPLLEEDIAIANMAQDELGHATVWYALHEALTGLNSDKTAFLRDAADFRNAPLLELPRGDWALTMLRRFLFDAYEQVLLADLAESSYTPLAQAAAKMRPEEAYHLRHSQLWLKWLGHGTDESKRRLQTALDTLWPFIGDLFAPLTGDDVLIEANIITDGATARQKWEALVLPLLKNANLTLPTTANAPFNRTHHTPHLERLLSDLQLVARADPEAIW